MTSPHMLTLGENLHSHDPVGHSLRLANRHGIIAGATGTGKTVTLQRLMEEFSDAGVAVFAADVKGDLCGIAAAGTPSGKIAERIASMAWLQHSPKSYPICFWDVFAKQGHPLRTTISDMGPLLLANLLELTDAQQAVLYSTFKVADRDGLLLLDMKDLKSMITHLLDNPQALGDDSALFTRQSANALLRKLATLEQQQADQFFGEPALQLGDILQPSVDGRGTIHVLDATRLVHEAPKLYATFLFWLLSELFEQLPERGDADKPLLALFFDEAHLLFKGTPKALQDRIEQVVRLIRSKGVGVYFVTQSPADLPDAVLAQLGLRVQHGLRAFTAKEQKSLKAVADGFRPNPAINTLQELTELGIGEALFATLEDKGTPSMVQKVAIAPPQSRVGPLTDNERQQLVRQSGLGSRYDKPFDRESAYEVLQARAEQAAQQAQAAEKPAPAKKTTSKGAANAAGGVLGNFAGKVVQNTIRQATNQISRQIVRGILGSFLGKK